MRIDIHTHLMSVDFLEHLRGRDGLPTAVRDAHWSNLGDRSLDDPSVLPVVEHIADRGAAIHLHPAPPPGQYELAPATLLGFAFPAFALTGDPAGRPAAGRRAAGEEL